MPRNANSSVHKEKEFGIYVLWKSLPAYAKGMKKSELVALGLTDPLMQRIVKIKSQTEFAKYFSIKDLGTLTDWNARIKRDGLSVPFLGTGHPSQHSVVAEKISLPHIAKLHDKVSEQAALLAALKRENTLLKKKLKSQRTKTSIKPKPSKMEAALSSPSVTSSEKNSDKTFYKTLKGLFIRKK